MTVTTLLATCEVENWKNLPLGEQLLLKLKWSTDPISFWEDPRGGNQQLWESQKQILRDFYHLTPEGKREKSELIFVSGMRGGKTTVSALITLYEVARMLFMNDPQGHYQLAPNSEIVFLNVAPKLEQTIETVFRRNKELLSNSPFFMSHEPYVTYNTIRFPNNLTIKGLGSNVKTNVGRTVKVLTAEEVSSFEDTEKHSPEEIYFKLSNSTGTFKPWNENIRVAISSIAGPGDFITSLYKQAQSENWPWAILKWNKTWELNPNMPLESLEEERRRHPEIFDRDFGAEEGVDTKAFFNEFLINRIKENSSKVLNLFLGDPPVEKKDKKYGFIPALNTPRLRMELYPDAVNFFIAADPAIKNDAFGLSVGYVAVDGTIKIIGSTVFIAEKGREINVEDIKNILKPILETFPVQAYIFDVYLHSDIQSLVRNYNVVPIQHNVDINDWLVTRNELYEGKSTIPPVDLLFKEYSELLLIHNKKVDHPSSGSKDMADTTAQLISFVRREEEEARLSSTAIATHFVGRF